MAKGGKSAEAAKIIVEAQKKIHESLPEGHLSRVIPNYPCVAQHGHSHEADQVNRQAPGVAYYQQEDPRKKTVHKNVAWRILTHISDDKIKGFINDRGDATVTPDFNSHMATIDEHLADMMEGLHRISSEEVKKEITELNQEMMKIKNDKKRIEQAYEESIFKETHQEQVAHFEKRLRELGVSQTNATKALNIFMTDKKLITLFEETKKTDQKIRTLEAETYLFQYGHHQKGAMENKMIRSLFGPWYGSIAIFDKKHYNGKVNIPVSGLMEGIHENQIHMASYYASRGVKFSIDKPPVDLRNRLNNLTGSHTDTATDYYVSASKESTRINLTKPTDSENDLMDRVALFIAGKSQTLLDPATEEMTAKVTVVSGRIPSRPYGDRSSEPVTATANRLRAGIGKRIEGVPCESTVRQICAEKAIPGILFWGHYKYMDDQGSPTVYSAY
jgi:hypothetical protein